MIQDMSLYTLSSHFSGHYLIIVLPFRTYVCTYGHVVHFTLDFLDSHSFGVLYQLLCLLRIRMDGPEITTLTFEHPLSDTDNEHHEDEGNHHNNNTHDDQTCSSTALTAEISKPNPLLLQ